jgi:hypothetical protein
MAGMLFLFYADDAMSLVFSLPAVPARPFSGDPIAVHPLTTPWKCWIVDNHNVLL